MYVCTYVLCVCVHRCMHVCIYMSVHVCEFKSDMVVYISGWLQTLRITYAHYIDILYVGKRVYMFSTIYIHVP